MRKKGNFVVKLGYEEDGMYFGKEALSSLMECRIYFNIYWKGLEIAPALDKEFRSKQIEVGKVLDYVLKKEEFIVKIELEQEVLGMIGKGQVKVEPIFTITDTSTIRKGFVIVTKGQLSGILLKARNL